MWYRNNGYFYVALNKEEKITALFLIQPVILMILLNKYKASIKADRDI